MAQRGARCPEFVTDPVLSEAAAYFQSVLPDEGVGFVTAGGFVPVPNIADGPTNAFAVDDTLWVQHAPVLAVLHSHTNGHTAPSAADLRSQKASAVPWGIICVSAEHSGDPIWFGDEVAISPLFGREFIHGVHDCYSLVRDAFRLGDVGLRALPDPLQRIYDWPFPPVALLDLPRDDGWWNHGENIYEEHFAEAGFEIAQIDRHTLSSLRVGDCFLHKLHSKVANHAGVYVGDGLILHHVTGYTSHRSPANLWGAQAYLWLRYVGPTKSIT